MSEVGNEIEQLTPEQIKVEFDQAQVLAAAANDPKLSPEKKRFNAEVLATKVHKIRSRLDPKIFTDLSPSRKYIRVDRDFGNNWGVFYNYENGSLYEGPSIDKGPAPDMNKIKPIQDAMTWAENGENVLEALHSLINVRQPAPHK